MNPPPLPRGGISCCGQAQKANLEFRRVLIPKGISSGPLSLPQQFGHMAALNSKRPLGGTGPLAALPRKTLRPCQSSEQVASPKAE